jgi:hypothetical protein
MIAGAALDHLDGECGAGEIDLLMKGSRNVDADLWAIAASCSSSEALAAALDRAATARPALSYLALNWTSGEPASELALADMLLRPEFLARVGDGQGRVQADVARFKLAKLLGMGLLEEALAFGDSLEPSIRRLALSPDREMIRTTIGGYRLVASPYHQAPAADYAAALALAGRGAEARYVLDLVAPAAKRRQARECLEAAAGKCLVGVFDGIPLGALIVDDLLEQPDKDPYVLVETLAVDHSSHGGGVAEALCRLLTRPDEQEECRSAREQVAENRVEKVEGDALAFWTALGRAGGPPFETARSLYAARLESLGPVEARPSRQPRQSVDPAPVPFRELPVPAGALARRPRESADPTSFAPLPQGYFPVRIERSGSRAAAISLSQRFDPNGEVTRGGYWLHLSDDGGKTWRKPLYTGLAEHFPYVVPTRYRMPMLAAGRIDLEVEEALIDTASIFYPPVGTRVKRKREGIYLQIPIADLARDSDGDGLSDISARHLLLDRPAPAGTPFIVGRDRDCAPPSTESLARLEILKALFRVEAMALIEPVGPRKDLAGPWLGSFPTDKPPIFLRGDPDDYRCVTLDRPMIVYGESDRDRLRKFSPDFQLTELPKIRWNRDRSRGFVQWNMGWTGGTYRLVRQGEGWKLESIQHWMS